MNFIEELKWRGMLHNITPDVEELLSSGKMITGYIGFDPTAKSLTIGNYVQLMLLNLFQKSGHRPVVLMGGATGRIGDPSGKSAERQLKTYEELDNNLNHQIDQMKQLLSFDSGNENDAILVNNLDFYKDMNVLEFLRTIGKNLTISYMMSKDSVKTRLESGLSFTEFSYQLLQGNDFLQLFNQHDCLLQMGGSDQWGNITSGIEFIRRNTDGKAYAVTTPLLTKADGTKFGKSEKGNLWLDGDLTSPYEFYQFWINASDADLPKFMRYFTFKSQQEVEQLEVEYKDDPNTLKRILAEELTTRIHGQEAYEGAQSVSKMLFNKKATRDELLAMNEKSLEMIANEIPSFSVSAESNTTLDNLLDGLNEIFSSKSELRRAVKANSLAINKVKMSSHEQIIEDAEWLFGKYMMIENGKKKKYILKKS